jgi:ABC-type transport system involved in multi-copper enzyme maturation permease subunit
VTAVIRAELGRLCRRRTMVIAAGASLLFAVVTTFSVFSAAPASGPLGPQGGTTLELLGREGGGTEAFATGASFVGFFVFVTFIALLAGEFSGGTLRALLLRNPNRLQVIVGKLVGILLVAAVLVAFAEIASFAIALLMAGGQDVLTSEWFTVGSVGAGLGDFASVFAGVAGWAVFGTTLAVVFRSAPLALGVGFAWAGPFENITIDSWETGLRVFPGQVLRAVIDGGTPALGFGRAMLTAALYVAVAAFVSAVLLTRRDVTA